MKARLERKQALGIVVIGLAILATVMSVFSRRVATMSSDVPVVRIAHTLVYDRAREVLDELIAEYEARQREAGHPVRVEQIVVPARMQPPWLRTQLIGGTPPDIVQQEPMGVDAVLVSRFLTPLSRELEEANPYNAGTPLAGVPWRNTFYDGLETTGYDFRLSQNFGVPLFGQTLRVVLNLERWKEVVRQVRGDEPPSIPPTGFREFLELDEWVQRYRAVTGRSLETLAGSGESAGLLFNLLHEHQTQRLALEVNSQGELWTDRPAHLISILEGERAFPTEAERSAYRLIRRVGGMLSSGSMMLSRDDAFFRFSQGQALMIFIAAPDAPALAATIEGRFPLAVFPLPLPSVDDPEFGGNVLGPITERKFPSGGTFVLVRQSDPAQQARALDFLRFLTALPSAQRLSDATGVVSATVGVDASPAVAPFLPHMEGFPGGLMFGSTVDQRRILQTRLNELLKPDGGVDAFVEAIRGPMMAQFPIDLRERRGQETVLQVQDALQSAAFFGVAAAGQEADERLTELLEVTLWYEWEKVWMTSQVAGWQTIQP